MTMFSNGEFKINKPHQKLRCLDLDDIYIVYLFSKGFAQVEISKILGLSASAIHQRLKKIKSYTGENIVSLNKKRLTEYDKSSEQFSAICGAFIVDLSWHFGLVDYLEKKPNKNKKNTAVYK